MGKITGFLAQLGGRAAIDLPAGRYLYCGSAKGPGGLKARLSPVLSENHIRTY
jgi:hypothetical protein